VTGFCVTLDLAYHIIHFSNTSLTNTAVTNIYSLLSLIKFPSSPDSSSLVSSLQTYNSRSDSEPNSLAKKLPTSNPTLSIRMCIKVRHRHSCKHIGRVLETKKCEHIEHMEQWNKTLENWIAKDVPDPTSFCQLLTAMCETESSDEYEERDDKCWSCRHDDTEKQERNEKGKGKAVHWEDQNKERDEGCGEGSSGGKAEETGYKWYLKDQNEDKDYEYEEEEDLYVYEAKKYEGGSSIGQEMEMGIGNFVKSQNEEDKDEKNENEEEEDGDEPYLDELL
jgi:hypothetical protein